MRRAVLIVGLAAGLAGACSTPEQPASQPQETQAAPAAATETANTVDVTREVVQRHLKTFGAGDLEGVLADYADDAVMFTPNGPIKGKAELRTAFQQFIAEWGQPGMKFNLTKELYEGENGYINWTAETAPNTYEYGVDGFTVRNGKIVVQFFGAKVTPKK